MLSFPLLLLLLLLLLDCYCLRSNDARASTQAAEFTYNGPSGFSVGPDHVTKPCDGCPLYIGEPRLRTY
jgi:hypothetical protein